MSNFLRNGTILPSGLLCSNPGDAMGAFKKTYQNSSLRFGIVIASYDKDDVNNISKLFPEYDVFVFEQNENKSSTPITYKNCTCASGFGSKADFFEARLRAYTKKTTKATTISLSGQNGAIVLLLCLNGLSDTGIIISALSHPDRPTTLTGSDPHLEGEYNGVNIKVNADGSTSLTFNGAKDNDGNIINASQGVTEIKIEKDGSFQVDHSAITFRLDKSGDATLTANNDVNVNAKGSINFQVQGDANIKVTGVASVVASEIDLNGSGGMILTTLTDPVVDLITGIPTIGVPTVKAG